MAASRTVGIWSGLYITTTSEARRGPVLLQPAVWVGVVRRGMVTGRPVPCVAAVASALQETLVNCGVAL